jgi:GNAT superfamily N-acetyltransferase
MTALERMEKKALLERLVRHAMTDVPGTEKVRLLMRHRSPAELAGIQHGVTNTFKKVEEPVKRVVHGVLDRIPHAGVKKVLKGGADLLIENPETIPMQAVPVPGLTLAYMGLKKGLEKGLDYVAPIHKAAAKEKMAVTVAELARAGTWPGSLRKKVAASTAWSGFKILDVAPTDKDHAHVLAHNETSGQLLHGTARHDSAPGTFATYTSFRPMPKADPQVMEVMSMHVEPEHRGKGYGKRLWGNVQQMHKGLTFMVQPDGFKDKNKTNEELGKVYESYGFKPSEKKGWFVLPPKGQTKLAFKLQGETKHQGLDIAIENRKGSVRSGTTDDGKKWRTVMKLPYGYIRDTKGADGEDIDCYVGPKKDAPNAYVVHQHKPDGTGYDEDKIMLGMGSRAEARKAYLAHYDDPKFLGPMKTVPMERLKALLDSKKKLVKISGVTQAALFEELVNIAAGSAL